MPSFTKRKRYPDAQRESWRALSTTSVKGRHRAKDRMAWQEIRARYGV